MQTPVWRIKALGSPEVFERATLELPKLAPLQVLIDVAAAGFNPVDTKIRAGLAPIAPEHGVLGSDVSGVIVAVGADVSTFNVGDAVYGCAGGVRGHGGALAKYMPAEAALLAHAPKSIALEDAAGLPIPAITALHVLRRLDIKAGDEVCVLGASGAVGQLITQLALHHGARVSGTGGNEGRLELIRSLGAEAYLHDVIGSDGQLFSKVVDTHGGSSLLKALSIASTYGHVATINARGSYDLSAAHAKALNVHAIFMLIPLLSRIQMESCGNDLKEITRLMDSSALKPPVINKVPMSDVALVHEEYERGQLNTKTVLVADF